MVGHLKRSSRTRKSKAIKRKCTLFKPKSPKKHLALAMLLTYTNCLLPMLLMPHGPSSHSQQHTTLRISIERLSRLKKTRFFFLCLKHLWSSCRSFLNTNLVTQMRPQSILTPPPRSHNPILWCKHHMASPKHYINDCWLLKHMVQDLIDSGTIAFDFPEAPSNSQNPLPLHNRPSAHDHHVISLLSVSNFHLIVSIESNLFSKISIFE